MEHDVTTSVMGISEALIGYQRGDPGAAEQLLRLSHPRILSVVGSVLSRFGSRVDHEDVLAITQSELLVLAKKFVILPRSCGPHVGAAWLNNIGKSLLSKVLREVWRLYELDESPDGNFAVVSEEADTPVYGGMFVQEAMRVLDYSERQEVADTFVLSLLGFTRQEISGIIGRAKSTVLNNVNRALKVLRDEADGVLEN